MLLLTMLPKRRLNTVSERSAAIPVTAQVLNQTKNTVAKTFFASFCRLFKHSNQTTKWQNELYFAKTTCAGVLRKACETAVFFDLLRQCTQTRIFQNLLIRI